jgi:xanthine dehydrogenase accessory factor
MKKPLVVVRGAGDIATGVICRLYKSGFDVVALEIAKPSVIRRTVSLAQAVYDGDMTIEGLSSRVANDFENALELLEKNIIPVLIDEKAAFAYYAKENIPNYLAFVDVTIAKKNIGTRIDMAPIVVGVGPGFSVGTDVNAIIETMRGHDLGRVLYEGSAKPNTGVPGEIGKESLKRLLKSPSDGIIKNNFNISDSVVAGQIVQTVVSDDGEVHPIAAEISGVIRGLISEGYVVTKGLKVGDIDPRDVFQNCFTISDKALAIGGGVLQAILELAGGVMNIPVR